MREGWVETTLGDVAEWWSGGTPRAREPRYYESGTVPWAVIADMSKGIINSTNSYITEEALELIGGRLAPVGSVLISMYATVGKSAIANIPLATNQAIAWSIPNQDKIMPFYLYLVSQQLEQEISDSARGATQRNINRQMLRDFSFQLPPLPEQKRIVDLVSSVDFYIDALQQQSESAKRSRNAVLHELLTAGGEGWVETTLGEVAHLNPEQARDYDSDRLIKYIDLSTVTFDTGISPEIDQLPFNEAPGRARRIIREKDVIVSTVRPYLKGFAFVGKEFNGQIASTGFCVIRAKSESILSELIWALVGSDDFVDFLIRRSTGSNYPAVRPNDISDFTFMLPPLHDQETVSKLITTFDDIIRASSVLINSAQNLRSGLLSDLLSGEHEIPPSYDKVIGAA
jgi:type I restriction enzyme S subunit